MKNDPHAPSDTDRVTKAQVFRFLESQFLLADQDKDGELDIRELQAFLNALSHPNITPRQIFATRDVGSSSARAVSGI